MRRALLDDVPAQLCTAPDCSHPSPDRPLCPSCVGALRGDLHALPELVDELTVTVARQDAVGERGGGGGGKKAEHPLVYRPDAADAGRELHVVLLAWCRHLADAAERAYHHLAPTSRPDIRTVPIGPARAPIPGQVTHPAPWSADPGIGRFPGKATVALGRWMQRHLGQAADDPAAGQLRTELGDAFARCWHAVDRPAARRYLGRCGCVDPSDPDQAPLVWASELWAAPAAISTTCRACGVVHDVEARHRALVQAALPLRVTAELASRALPVLLNDTVEVTPELIRSWVRHRGLRRYPPSRWDPLGRHRYRIGDVLDLAVAAAQRAQGRIVAAPDEKLPTELAALFGRVREHAAAARRPV